MAFQIENFAVFPAGKTLKATADIVLDGGVHIYGVKLIQGRENRLFMAMPSKKEGSHYLEHAAITDMSLRKRVETGLIAKYQTCTATGDGKEAAP